MISCIICSRNSEISEELRNNIERTIGCDYELVIIDNSKKKYNIFKAYNEGVRRAKGDILCFMHDDIRYVTNLWGGVVFNHLSNSQVGIIGVVGGHFLPRTVSGWYHPMISSGGCVQVENKIENKLVSFYNQDTIIDNRVEVVAIDGMWFCIRRELFDNDIMFDENIFNSFHCYDLDICLQSISKGYKNFVVDNILIKHTSYGNFNLDWYKESIKLYDKWAKILPLYKGIAIDDKEIETRTKFVEQVMVWLYAYAKSQYELQNIRKSKAYKLGKFITKVINRFRL